MIRTLTTDEAAALHAFAAKHGRSWKRKLAEVYWYNARVWNGFHCLHALRNDPAWGHDGLRFYRLPKVAAPQTCKWFALCDNAAERRRSHPVLGSVPICARCDDKMARIMCAA